MLTLAGQAFPAQQYGLVLWSHADGWLPPTSTDYGGYGSPLATTHRPLSFGIDSGPDGHMGNTGAEMAVDDIARAVHRAGLHLRYIFMDCCLMQTLETAYALRQVCDYITASPAPIPGSGANYEHQLRNGLLADDPTAMARTYLADEAQQTHYGDFGLVISCLRTDRLDALAAALHAALPHATLAGHTEADMTDVLHYLTYSPSYGYRPHSYDARQALSTLLPAAQQTAVLACLDDAVVWRGATEACWIGPHDWQFAHIDTAAGHYAAVSMFVPQSIYTTQAARCWYGDLNQAFHRMVRRLRLLVHRLVRRRAPRTTPSPPHRRHPVLRRQSRSHGLPPVLYRTACGPTRRHPPSTACFPHLPSRLVVTE